MIPAFAAEVLGGLSAKLGIPSVGGNIDSWLNPQTVARKAADEQWEWFNYPSNIPGVGELLKLDQTGWFDLGVNGAAPRLNRQDFGVLMRIHGVAGRVPPSGVGGEEYFKRNNAVWNMLRDAMKVRPGISEAFQGLISGALTREQFATMMMRNGANAKDWEWLVPFVSNRITPDQAIEVWRRGGMTKEELKLTLKYLQFGVQDDIDDLLDLSAIIPGPNDIIRFAVREAFNPEQIKLLGLDLELDQNTEFLAWAKAAGLSDVTITTDSGKEITQNFAKLYWYAHWELPSPGQVYDFFHKYYGNSRYGPSPYLKYAKEFTQQHMVNLLKANDYSPAFRDHLAGAANLPYTRIDVRRLRQDNVIKKEDVYHNYRASGYDDEHANNLTEWLEIDIKNHQTSDIKSGTKSQLCKAYQLGLADSKDVINGLVGVGYTADQAKGQLGLCDMTFANGYTSEAVKIIKQGFLTGAFTVQEAERALQQFKLDQKRIDDYLDLWGLKMKGTRKQVSTQMVVSWFLDGIIGLDDLTSRLTKMQYSPVDVTRIIQAALLEQSKRVARAQKQAQTEAQKTIERNLKEAEKARKQAEQLRREQNRQQAAAIAAANKAANDRLRAFLSGRTEANLRAWLKENTITDDDVRYTFEVRGWNPTDIERWLIDAHKRK